MLARAGGASLRCRPGHARRLFAGFGCEIVATDLGEEEADQAGWVASGQHSADPSQLNRYGCAIPRPSRNGGSAAWT